MADTHRNAAVRTAAIALLALAPAVFAGASGAPGPEDAEATDANRPEPSEAFGGLAALGPTPVVLSAVQIVWPELRAEPFPRYRIKLSYRLRNPGPAREQRVGVRATWGDHHTARSESRPPRAGRTPPEIRVDGRPFACELGEPEWRPWGPGTGFTYGVETWCAGTLALPSGESTHVVEYEATASSRGHIWSTLRYGFEAEATWAGPLETLDLALPLSRLPAFPVIVSPVPFSDEGGVVKWHFTRPDPRALPPLYVGMNALQATPARPRAANGGYTFAASSRLAPQGALRYDPDRALDADGATAWCEGVPGAGIGEWLEVRPHLDPAVAARCGLLGFEIIPGLARDREVWLANNRIDKVRISSCSHPDEHVDVDLSALRTLQGAPHSPPDDPRASPQPVQLTLEGDQLDLPGTRTNAFLHERSCFRLTILGVRKGRVDDSCIAEFLPLLSCSDGGATYPIRPVR